MLVYFKKKKNRQKNPKNQNPQKTKPLNDNNHKIITAVAYIENAILMREHILLL